MAKSVIGLYDSVVEAQNVVQDLVDNGFPRQDISVVVGDHEGHYARYGSQERANEATEGLALGAAGGGVLGGIVGLLVGLGALTIPGIGPVLAAGPLAASLGSALGASVVGAGVGAVAGGLIGALAGVGVPEEDARLYAEGVRRGGALVSVNTEDALASKAHEVLQRHNPVNLDERAATWGGNRQPDRSQPYREWGTNVAKADDQYVRPEGTYATGMANTDLVESSNVPEGSFATGMTDRGPVETTLPSQHNTSVETHTEGSFATGMTREPVVETTSETVGSFATGMAEESSSALAGTPGQSIGAGKEVRPEQVQYRRNGVRIYEYRRPDDPAA